MQLARLKHKDDNSEFLEIFFQTRSFRQRVRDHESFFQSQFILRFRVFLFFLPRGCRPQSACDEKNCNCTSREKYR